MSVETVAPPDRVERLAAWLLRGPLAAAIALLIVVELATWAPSYLTWPWWADQDVFATAAYGWEHGVFPYRDLLGNNFPGTTYLFWALGKLCGWGYMPAFWAVDVGFVLALGGAWFAWSWRRFGRVLPAAVGYLAFVGYYLNLDYSQAAQRDWHGPFFAVLGLLIAQTWTGRGGRVASALALATGLAFRPQAILFAPAFLLAIDEAVRKPGESFGRTVRAVLEWGIVVAVGLVLWFTPLFVAGLWDDFLHSLRITAYGGGYNQVSAGRFARTMLIQLLDVRIVITGLVLALLLATPVGTTGRVRRLAPTWLAVLGLVLLYRPLSPNPFHAYLTHPITLGWSVGLSMLAAALLELDLPRPSVRLAAVLLVLGLGASGKPRFCNPVGSWQALADLRRGTIPEASPTGYTTHPESKSAGRYDWRDYRDLLDYLRHDLGPKTKIANALRHVPALTGPAARLPAFPAESVAWIRVVNAKDEPKFVAALEEAEDSIVVWDPNRPEKYDFERLPRLEAAIRRLYEPSVRFGILEVWRRKARP